MEINTEEKEYLLDVLKDELGTLREQLYRAEAPAFKDQLRREKALLETVLAKVGTEPTAGRLAA
jgi:hypothetical protein